MRLNPIRIQDIQKRQQRINSTPNGINNVAITEATLETIMDSRAKDDIVRKLFTQCRDTESAERCIPYLIKHMNESSDSQINYLLSEFTENIAPLISDNANALSQLSKIKNDEVRFACETAIKDNVTIDKILENHERISKRFDVTGYVREHDFNSSPDSICSQICEWIDTYNMPSYAKLQTALEETEYLFQKSGVNYSNKDIVQCIVEHYILTDGISTDSARKVLEQSKIISKDDTQNVRYLFNEYVSDDIQNALDAFKTEQLDESKFKQFLNKIYTKSPEQIIDGTPNILAWMRQIIVLSTFGTNIIVGGVIFIADKFVQMNLSRKQIDKVWKVFNNEKDKTQKAIDKSDGEKRDTLQSYADSLDKAITSIDIYRNKLYTYEELKKQDEIDNESANMIPITLEEFKNFKFNNLLSLAWDASNYIQDAYNKGVDKVRAKVKGAITKNKDVDEDGFAKKKSATKVSKVLKDGLKSIASHFTEAAFDANMNIFDAVLVTFDVSESTAEDIYDFMVEICEDVNNRYSRENVKFYSNTVGDTCEIHAIDTTPIMLTESEKEALGYFSETDIDTVKEFYYLCSLVEAYESYKPTEILTDLLNSSLGFSEAYTIMDLCKYSGISEADGVWDRLINKYTNKGYDKNDYTKIHENTMINSLQYEFCGDVPFDIKVESCRIMRGILNEGIDMSGAKAAIIGMKDKVKNLGVKEKEISKDMDVAASGFMRSIENALTNDRREAIIKGSIIPSFSKCMKVALAAGATSVIVNPTAAVIGLMGTLAGSRYLNNRERMLLLDEIEVELKVVEKELQKAENDDDMAKYRKLLTYQKRLKKEDFKLRYNVSRKMGKDYLTRKEDDER